jgi:hypothetical protein
VAAAFGLAGRPARRYLDGVMHSNRPNRRIPRSRAVALQQPRPLGWPGAEWMTAAAAVTLLSLALLLP